MKCIKLPITDAAIRRHQHLDIRQISDTRYPIKFRYGKDRKRGSWYVVTHQDGRSNWRKVGPYPALTAKRVIDNVPQLMADIVIKGEFPILEGDSFTTVSDLLNWYQQRVAGARYLSKTRRSAIKTIVGKHLTTALGSCLLSKLSHRLVDEKLIRPMQARYSLAYTRQVFDVLRIAFKQAHKMRLIESNPIAGFVFGDFIAAPIKAKEGKLKRTKLPALFTRIEAAPADRQMLVLLIMLHGTRIGETRQAKWTDIDWGDRVWNIPAENTKTGEPHRLPLSDHVVALLKRYRVNQEASRYSGVWLFPNHKGRCAGSSLASDMISAVGQGDWTAHDLRKLARTTWADLGVDYMVSERLLNHKLSKLDQAYIHTYVESQKRTALQKYHNWLVQTGLSECQLNF